MNTSSFFLALSIFLSILYLSLFSFLEVQCAAIDATLTTRYPVVYRRYVRRRSPMVPADQYVDEFVEVFHTQHKPPAIKNPMSDEDIDKFIFCDFHRETDACKQYWNSKNHIAPKQRPATVKPAAGVKTTKGTTSTSTTTTTTSSDKTASTTSSATSTITRSPPTSSGTSTTSTTSTTTSSPPTSSATYTTTTSKSTSHPSTTPTSGPVEVIPRIPDISFEEYNDVDGNADDYDGANDYADEEDLEDQNQNTTTIRSPFNFFRF